MAEGAKPTPLWVEKLKSPHLSPEQRRHNRRVRRAERDEVATSRMDCKHRAIKALQPQRPEDASRTKHGRVDEKIRAQRRTCGSWMAKREK
jgi:hypothetical protein